ncbi:hypothetical protein ACHAXN_011763 [Cyclotella atomus]
MDIASENSQSTSTAATAIACIVGIVAFVQLSKKFSNNQPAHHNGCNDPKCIRCHSNSSHHIDAFRRNATLLRRLVKLEPEMFEGMRDDIWAVVEGMEKRYVPTANRYLRIFDYAKSLLGESKANTPESVHPIAKKKFLSVPLSPQTGQKPTVFLLPSLEAIPFHNRDKCHHSCPCLRLWKRQPIDPKSPPIYTSGDIEMLQKNFHIIRTELDNLLASNENQFAPFDSAVYTSTTTQHNKQTPEWSSIYLYHQGLKQSTCHDYFPQTTNIIETFCPNRMAGKCGLGSIYFSKLKSNTKVNAHYGPTNVRWRCHLPVNVPSNCSDSRLCVGIGTNEEKVGWEEGVPILFDDSFLHSAVHVGIKSDDKRNGQDGSRTVLIIDFWHPSLSEADRNAIGVLYPPGS